MLDKQGKWSLLAIVRGAKPHGKSYIIETDAGIYLINRKSLKANKQEINNQGNNSVTETETGTKF